MIAPPKPHPLPVREGAPSPCCRGLCARRLLAAALVLLCAPAAAAEDFIDREHERLSLYANHLAGWFDGFWGHHKADQESPYSKMRLRPGYSWDEADGSDGKLHFKAHFKLPALENRLTVLLLGEPDDFAGNIDQPALNSDDSHTLGLQYNLHHGGHSRFDAVIGLKKGLREKFGAKYRYHRPLWGDHFFHLSEQLIWIRGRGWGALTHMVIDQVIGENAVMRWENRLQYTEWLDGFHWQGRYGWQGRLNDRSAARAFAYASAQTKPNLFDEAGLGLGYRTRLHGDWLSFEVETRYGWRKEAPGLERGGVAQVQVRLEAAFGGPM